MWKFPFGCAYLRGSAGFSPATAGIGQARQSGWGAANIWTPPQITLLGRSKHGYDARCGDPELHRCTQGMPGQQVRILIFAP